MLMHLDFLVDDLEATGKRVLAAGATLLDFQPKSDHCFVYADPAGHPFCLSTWDSRGLVDGSDDGHAGESPAIKRSLSSADPVTPGCSSLGAE